MSTPSEDTVSDREKDADILDRLARGLKADGYGVTSKLIHEVADRLRTLPEVQTPRCGAKSDGCQCKHQEGHDGPHFDGIMYWPEVDSDRPESEAGYVVLYNGGVATGLHSRPNAELIAEAMADLRGKAHCHVTVARVVPVTEDTSKNPPDSLTGGGVVKAGGSEEATGPSVWGIALDVCPSCGSGDVAWCGISKRGHCRECDFWQSPHWGNSMEGVKAWNNHRLRPPPTASVEATPPAGPCPDCEGRRPFNCKSCGVRSVPGDAERDWPAIAAPLRAPTPEETPETTYGIGIQADGTSCNVIQSGFRHRIILDNPAWTDEDAALDMATVIMDHLEDRAAAPEGGENEAETFTLDEIDAALYNAHRDWDERNMVSFSTLMVKHLRSLSRGTKP